MSDAIEVEIDAAILALLRPQKHWRKVAFIVGRAADALGNKIPDGDEGYQIVGQRIQALFDAGKVDVQGDITQWRFSEVRISNEDTTRFRAWCRPKPLN